MQVKLFDAPQNIDQKVVFLARVSSENQNNPKYERLIKYLLKEGHYSPFDMVNMTFEINTEKDVGIQLLRHQTLKPQEWSQRYADCSDMKAPLRECRIQDLNNRQNSIVTHDIELIDWWLNTQKEVQDLTFKRYQEALEKGIAKELARSILTIGLTSTKMYFNASLRSWLFYCLSRTHVSTQKEHRIVAKELLTILLDIAPCATNAFIKLFMLNKKDQYDFDFNLLTKE